MKLKKAAQDLLDHWDAGEYKNCTGDMAGYISALREALEPPGDRLPKKLSESDQGIVNFCATPRTSWEIANHARTTMSAIYRRLRLLQRLGLLEKLQVENPSGHNHGVTFRATGKSIEDNWIPEYMQVTSSVMGVRL